jgi:hypothetical protein
VRERIAELQEQTAEECDNANLAREDLEKPNDSMAAELRSALPIIRSNTGEVCVPAYINEAWLL